MSSESGAATLSVRTARTARHPVEGKPLKSQTTSQGASTTQGPTLAISSAHPVAVGDAVGAATKSTGGSTFASPVSRPAVGATVGQSGRERRAAMSTGQGSRGGGGGTTMASESGAVGSGALK